MQINSNRLTDYSPLVQTDGRNNSRLPVAFDAELKPVFSKDRADNATVVLPATPNQDRQQARFVRDFITTERQLNDSDSKRPLLPATVQQYLYIRDIPNQQDSVQGQFLDEMV